MGVVSSECLLAPQSTYHLVVVLLDVVLHGLCSKARDLIGAESYTNVFPSQS